MATGAPVAYTVEDRSLLLPYYRRFFVDPTLPYLPASLNPNTITHAGHLFNLAGVAILVGLWPKSGWPFALATVLLQVYLWCDNADGAHARRTGQCSRFGEFLDHGLDQMNTVYIAYLTALGLGAPPIWWVAIALIIPGAGALTYWEQASTGVFRLGLLNQVESLTVLSGTLLASAIFGTAVFEQVSVHGFTLRLAMLLWASSTILFGMARAIVRVGSKNGLASVLPALAWIFFAASVAGAAQVGAVSTVGAVVLATGGNITLGMRMLSRRLHGEPPRVELSFVAFGVVLSALVACCLVGVPLNPLTAPIIVAVSCAVFGLQSVVDARVSVQHLDRAEESAAPH